MIGFFHLVVSWPLGFGSLGCLRHAIIRIGLAFDKQLDIKDSLVDFTQFSILSSGFPWYLQVCSLFLIFLRSFTVSGILEVKIGSAFV